MALYFLAWVIVFSTSRPAVGLYRQALDPWTFPKYLHGANGKRFALLAACSILISSILALLWGFLHLDWCSTIGGVVLGLLGSVVAQALISASGLILFGPPLLVLLVAILWILLR